MAQVQFEDISIVSNRTSKPPRKEGSSKEGKDRFMVTFNLSSNPKGPWIASFNRTWDQRSKRTPSIPLPIVSDDQIQITCPIDDQVQSHLDDLKQDVAIANRLYREYLQAADDEKRSHDEVLQNLRF
jgi:hypothetical protein